MVIERILTNFVLKSKFFPKITEVITTKILALMKKYEENKKKKVVIKTL